MTFQLLVGIWYTLIWASLDKMKFGLMSYTPTYGYFSYLMGTNKNYNKKPSTCTFTRTKKNQLKEDPQDHTHNTKTSSLNQSNIRTITQQIDIQVTSLRNII